MRKEYDLCGSWRFYKDCIVSDIEKKKFETVSIPHTWNAVDGQDGGNDYFRGSCCYVKTFQKPHLNSGSQLYIRFDGVNSVSDVYLNNKAVFHHEGGYSAFQIRIDELLEDQNTLCVQVDNRVNHVYPQAADFTFYGGIYRPVSLVEVQSSHFSFGPNGGNGVRLTPSVEGTVGKLDVQAWVEGSYDEVRFAVLDNGTAVAVGCGCECSIKIPSVHLWNGLGDPFLYKVKASVIVGDCVVDCLDYDIGFRTVSFDPEKGFFLNGSSYPLRGVSRHQDRMGYGNALTEQMHDQDMDMILEVGANSIRLAHYQHSQHFFDLCDRKGVLVWAEIPYITKHNPDGRENTISQLKELIEQNYNHTSIFCWGISNEITAGGNSDDLYDNNCALRDIAHKMDSTRVVSMAHAFMLPMDDRVVSIPDIAGYNLYYGWYLGEMDGNGGFLDSVHERHPNLPLGLTEFGCDANLAFQNSNPVKGDYSETYQALFHEFMCSEIDKRPYLWGTYIWNMFDFGADARDEGGTKGFNCKGLVTADRKVRKDAFYAVKAWYSDEPFVHICGRRYVRRAEDVTQVKVYSNQSRVELRVNGKTIGVKEGSHTFCFDVRMEEKMKVEAFSGDLTDCILIEKVPEVEKSYVYSAAAEIANWFAGLELKYPEGYFSINDKIGDIIKVPEGRAVFDSIMALRKRSKSTDVAHQVETTEYMIQVTMKDVQLSEMLRRSKMPDSMILDINRKLNQIPKA